MYIFRYEMYASFSLFSWRNVARKFLKICMTYSQVLTWRDPLDQFIAILLKMVFTVERTLVTLILMTIVTSYGEIYVMTVVTAKNVTTARTLLTLRILIVVKMLVTPQALSAVQLYPAVVIMVSSQHQAKTSSLLPLTVSSRVSGWLSKKQVSW